MKKTLSLVFLLMAVIGQPSVLMAETVKCLVLIPSKDAPVYFPLDDEPVITFRQDTDGEGRSVGFVMDVKTPETTLSVPTYKQNKIEIKDVDFSGLPADNVISGDDVWISGDDIVIKVVSAEVEFSIVKLDGTICNQGVLRQGIHALKMSDFGSGVHILKVGDNVIKFARK